MMGKVELTYPTPRPPMIGHYLARRPSVALLTAVIDRFCSVFGSAAEPAQPIAIKSILVSQCGHLGDLIMTLPALHWIRQNRPEVRIGLVVGSWAKPVLDGIAGLYDKTYFADHFMLDRSARSRKEKILEHRLTWSNAVNEIRRDRYDVGMECFPFLPNAILLLFASRIPIRVGFTSGGFGPLLTRPVTWRHEGRPYLDYLRDLLKVIFPDPSLSEPLQAYYPPPAAADLPQAPYIVLHSGAGNRLREWPDDRWISLASDLAEQGVSIVLAGSGERERERAERIQANVGSAIINLCGQLTWDEFVALIAGASHVVCLESSTSHVAAAFRIPSTVIMSGTNEYRQFGPANVNARILRYNTPCAPCFRTTGCEHMICLKGVTADQVFQSIAPQL
ncbi:glycosyltransferase family 9 protein [Bradyrhizobium diazoefficiens]|uniref:glycosyltransferase family 9 protein n=1 Tax=Bradyrhizobium diazoefficiens TaxID=1355477 RepID=UPI00190B8FD0|nr:glycosyltransferase family 9 protein [Bradyrhizobium diazoefficiens]QQO13542.1 glycosyltransferase family 9 protein [Bradyrhizobium diazoefficiens]